MRLSQHFSSVVLLSAGHSTIINHKLLFHGNPAILLLQNHCHHDPLQIPAAMGEDPLPVPSANVIMAFSQTFCHRNAPVSSKSGSNNELN